jgi:hypothetical protein
VSILLAAIEFVQLYLPGRTAESTDPLLAIIMGIVLKLLDSPGTLARFSRQVENLRYQTAPPG